MLSDIQKDWIKENIEQVVNFLIYPTGWKLYYPTIEYTKNSIINPFDSNLYGCRGQKIVNNELHYDEAKEETKTIFNMTDEQFDDLMEYIKKYPTVLSQLNDLDAILKKIEFDKQAKEIINGK